MFCDLHMHSTASDGTDAPDALPRLAKQAGLAAIALTDHDTTAGLPACADAARAARIDFIPGIELSADPSSIPGPAPDTADRPPRGTLHLLGYFIRHDDPQLARVQERLRRAREERNPAMVERLNELGVNITYDEVLEAAGALSAGGSSSSDIVGRPHIAQVMVQKGYVRSIHEAFARYIGEGGEAYVRKDRLAAADAIAAITAAGGLAFLAHPVQLRLDSPDELEHLVKRLAEMGLAGIETRHSDHTPADAQRFEHLAERFDLLTCGGSDYHGGRKAIQLGGVRVPFAVYERLRDAHAAAA